MWLLFCCCRELELSYFILNAFASGAVAVSSVAVGADTEGSVAVGADTEGSIAVRNIAANAVALVADAVCANAA